MNKLLILGGSNSQVPAIIKAKELGYYVITCDYLPDNPGHKYADEYVNVSSTDKEAVLNVAQEKNIDGIIAYASDPSATTAAYIIDNMGICGANYQSTQILAEKDLFRSFLAKNGFNYPTFVSVSENDSLHDKVEQIPIPCMVKPVDASGSKGISMVNTREDLYEAYQYALGFSIKKRVIFEEYIETSFCQLHGDGFVFDRKLVFMELGDQRFYDCVPIGSSCPSTAEQDIQKRIWMDVSKLIEKIDFETGGINVEVRIGNTGEIYIIEIGPRTGGNYVPQLMEQATGYQEMSAVLEAAMGDYVPGKYERTRQRYCFQYIIGARKEGDFQEIWINPKIRDNVAELYVHKKPGDRVSNYKNSSGVVGVAILTFHTREQMECVINDIDDYVNVVTIGGE